MPSELRYIEVDPLWGYVANRDQLIRDTFVDLADTLASDYDVGEFLHLLVQRCEDVLSVTTCGVLVEAQEGGLRLAAATSSEMHRLEQVEIDLMDGPSFEAYRRVEPIVSQDLRDERQRWPQVLDQAFEMGLLTAYAFPLRLRDDCIGALSLYRNQLGAFDEDDVQLAQAFADVAAIGILQERKITRAEQRAHQLQHALDSRVVIEQAKGILAERHGVSLGQAFERLRHHARSNNLKVRDICHDIINGRSLPPLHHTPGTSSHRSRNSV